MPRHIFSPIPNRELLDFILWRLDPTPSQKSTALRTQDIRERHLYKSLIEAGVRLPFLTPRQAGLQGFQVDALFEVMFKRGAYDLKGFPMNQGGPMEFKRELWELMRGEGFVWDFGRKDRWRAVWSLGIYDMIVLCDGQSVCEGRLNGV